MKQLYLTSVSDVLASAPLHKPLVSLLFIEHLLSQLQQPLLVSLNFYLLLLLTLLHVRLRLHFLFNILWGCVRWLLLSVLFGDNILIEEF